MADFSSVRLPQSSIAQHSHVIPALEAAGLVPADLLSRDARSLATVTRAPILDIARLQRDVNHALRAELLRANEGNPDGEHGHEAEPQAARKEQGEHIASGNKLYSEKRPLMISTLDSQLDAMLGGGIPLGFITEVVGESGAGKTQFLISLLLAAQLPSPHGAGRSAIYISTEHALPTQRLSQLLSNNRVLTSVMRPQDAGSAPALPSLSRILTMHTPDLETQEHILTYQLPVACTTHKPALVVLDSIAANYRDAPGGAAGLAARAASLQRIGGLLRQLAQQHDCAVVVSNHVADRFLVDSSNGNLAQAQPPASSATIASSPPSSDIQRADELQPYRATSSPHTMQRPDLKFIPALTLDHQQRFFTGWGASSALPEDLAAKTPALGLVWANQIAARIAIVKEVALGRPHDSQVAEPRREGAPSGRHADAIAHPTEGGNGGTEGSAEWAPRRWRRWVRLVFASWEASTSAEERGVEVEIWAGGIRAVAEPRHSPPRERASGVAE